MSLIATTGRRSIRIRILLTSLYLLLTTGAFTMIYPFLLMISGSTKSAVDEHTSHVIPEFLYKDDSLYRKFCEGFFNESLEMTRIALATNLPTFRRLNQPTGLLPSPERDLWLDFLEQNELPFYMYQPSFLYTPVSRGTIAHNLRHFKKQLATRCNGNISRLNEMLNTDFPDWNSVFVIPRNYLERRIQPEITPFLSQYNVYKKSIPRDQCYTLSVPGYYRHVFLRALYHSDISYYNQIHTTSYPSWNAIPFFSTFPAQQSDAIQEDWTLFTREIINALWICSESGASSQYQDFLHAKYESIADLNSIYASNHKAFTDIPLYSPGKHGFGVALADWTLFIEGWRDPNTQILHQLPAKHIRYDTVENRYRTYLQKHFSSLEEYNQAIDSTATQWDQVNPPRQQALFALFSENKATWKKEFMIRNYLSVLEYIFLHGRALFNTVIYCSLSILLALIINPLAAYALSRYKPPTTYTLLLFLMMTMAFPPMVTQIPVFLMLRQLNLLNTFWALVLPGIANGFSIFLLKGFFDSLPRDLYDSAALDGAGEFTIFWHITISLSKPILAVIALNAFTLAYSNFMMALLICQDETMWTLMPWLYQLQQRSGQGVIFSSLLIAAIPTFIVFSLCQNIIMRGIVIPVEK